jgi:hypothetical protein
MSPVCAELSVECWDRRLRLWLGPIRGAPQPASRELTTISVTHSGCPFRISSGAALAAALRRLLASMGAHTVVFRGGPPS